MYYFEFIVKDVKVNFFVLMGKLFDVGPLTRVETLNGIVNIKLIYEGKH
jgi:hypothetical protein